MQIALVYDVILDHQILVQKLSSVRIVGMYATNFCSSKKYILWLFLLEEVSNGYPISKIKLLVSTSYKVVETVGL